MKVKNGDKIVYKANGVEREGIVTNSCVLDFENSKDAIEVCSFITEETTLISKSDVVMIVRENNLTTVINEVYEKPNEKFVRVYYVNGKRKEDISPLRLFVRFYFDHNKHSFCMEINGAKNPYPFRKAYGINPNMVERCLSDLGWKKIKTQYWVE